MFYAKKSSFKKTAILFAFGSALLLAGAAPVAAQSSTEWRTKPAADRFRAASTKDAVVEFAEYTDCVVERRTDFARAAALAPYGTTDQQKRARKVTDRDEDLCFRPGGSDMRMSFSTELLAGALAQLLVRADYPDLPALVSAYQPSPQDEAARVKGMHPGEVFGRCVVRRNPTGVLALLSSPWGSPAESQATRALTGDMSQCLTSGSKLEITKTFLRNVTGVAAYRLAQQVTPRGRVLASSK
jgi:hypothetical protein